MKLIMAVSADGFVARKQDDDMSWLGWADKAVFRILTGVGSAPLCVGRRSAMHMPVVLPGRILYQVDRDQRTLEAFYAEHPDAWLLGGQKLALYAIEAGMVSEAHICRSARQAYPRDESAIEDQLTLALYLKMSKVLETKVHDVTVENWKLRK